MRRVLLIHFQFPPDSAVGAQITTKFAKYLPDFGWDPFVLTAAARYYESRDPTLLADVHRWDHVRRTRRIPHPRYAYVALKAWRQGRRHDPLMTPPGAAVSPRSLRHTLRSLLTTPDDLTGWIPFAVSAGLGMIRRHGIERLFSSGPPWTNHLVGYALSRLTGVPWVASFEDPWTHPYTFVPSTRTSPLAMAVERRLERAVIGRAYAVICLNDHHRHAMAAQYPAVPASRFVVIPNGWDPDDFAAADHLGAIPPRDRLVVSHTGRINYGRTPRQLFQAVRRLLDSGVTTPRELSLRFIGDGIMAESRPVADMVAEFGLGDVVEIRRAIPRAEAIAAMRASHVLLVLAHGWILQIPAKTYQYLRAGRPVLAVAPEGATADFVRRTGAGVVVGPADVDGMADHLARSLRRLRTGESFQSAVPESVVSRFERRRLTADLASLLARPGVAAGAHAPILVAAPRLTEHRPVA
jgi:glycosyltransferase involved in cell wall biosynthesis